MNWWTLPSTVGDVVPFLECGRGSAELVKRGLTSMGTLEKPEWGGMADPPLGSGPAVLRRDGTSAL